MLNCNFSFLSCDTSTDDLDCIMGIKNIVCFKVSYLHLPPNLQGGNKSICRKENFFFQWQADIFITFYFIF